MILVVQALLATQDGNQLAQLVALMALFIVQRDKIVQIAGFIYRKLEKVSRVPMMRTDANNLHIN